MMIRSFLNSILLLFAPFLLNAQQLILQVEGDASFNNNLTPIRESGEDYSSSLEAESTLNVSVMFDNQLDSRQNTNEKWRVFIHKLNMEWDNDLVLEARRTGKGSRPNNPGNPRINDGDNFQKITDIPVYFFRGMGEISQIPLTLQLSNFSVTMGARDFETSLVFTVYDDW